MDAFTVLNQWAETWCAYMAYRMLDSAAALAVVGSLWLVIRRRVSVHFGYILFVLVLIKLSLPSPVSLPSLFLSYMPHPLDVTPRERISTSWNPESAWRDNPPWTSPGANRPPASIAEEGNLTAYSYLLVGWVMIASFFLLRLGWIIWKTRFMISNTIPLNPRSIPIDLDRLKQSAGIHRKVRWVTGDWVKSPMAHGYFHPVIAVPKDMQEDFTPNQIRWILLHELAHIRRGDFGVAFFQQILQALFFFNPLVWWVNAIVDRLREYACDDAALVGSQTSPKECGEGFLGVVMQTNNLPTFSLSFLGMIDYEMLVNLRLMRILTKNRVVESRLSIRSSLVLLGFALLVLPFGMHLAYAQLMQWTLIPTDVNNQPIHRAAAGMVYDSNRGVIVFHGGMVLGGVIPTETWEWKDQDWYIASLVGPMRCAAGMAYDPLRKLTILDGGYNTAIDLNLNDYEFSTWIWDGRDWRGIVRVEDEPPRACQSLVYFPELQSVIRHGGIDGPPDDSTNVYFNDTSLWDGSRWIKIVEGPPRALHKLVYDSRRKKVVLWGGMDSVTHYPEDTWEFDGVRWEQAAVQGPEGRHWHGMAFDEARGVTILYGGIKWIGYIPNDFWMGDQWEWDGTVWTELTLPNPGSATSPEMAYDSHKQTIVVYIPSGRGEGRSLHYGEDPTVEVLEEMWEYGPVESSGIRWPWGRMN